MRFSVNDVVQASYLGIVKMDEMPHYIDEGLFKTPSDTKEIIDLGGGNLGIIIVVLNALQESVNFFVCHTPNHLSMNPAPNNTREVFKELHSNMSLGALEYLEQVNILETLEYDVKQDSLKPIKFILPYFHPRRHIPPVNWTHGMNISPILTIKVYKIFRLLQILEAAINMQLNIVENLVLKIMLLYMQIVTKMAD